MTSQDIERAIEWAVSSFEDNEMTRRHVEALKKAADDMEAGRLKSEYTVYHKAPWSDVVIGLKKVGIDVLGDDKVADHLKKK